MRERERESVRERKYVCVRNTCTRESVFVRGGRVRRHERDIEKAGSVYERENVCV